MSATVLVERAATNGRRRRTVTGMRVVSGEARKGRIGRACRSALASGVVAVAVMLCAVAAAHAQAETFELHFIPSADEQSSAVTGIYQCQPIPRPCPGNWTLQLERGGQLLGIATARNFDAAGVQVHPQGGDVVRFVRAGIDDVTVTYDGLPAFDDTSCAMIGQRTISGSVTDWHTTFNFAWSAGVQSTFSRAGNRFQATGAEPLRRGDVLWAFSKGTRALSPSQTLTMTSTPTAQICGPADSAPLYELKVTGPRTAVRPRVGTNRRFTLRRNRVDCPAGVPYCQVRIFARRIARREVRDIGFHEYKVAAGSKRRVKARLFRSAMKRLKRNGRMDADVLVRLDVPPGDYRVKPILERIRVTLRAP